MSETAPPASVSRSGLPKGPWPALTPMEQRVLGVLIEKQKTTPEVYPMTLNALTVGCNQKSNRDPVTNLSDEEVMDVLDGLRSKSLAIKVTGSRVDRFRHLLYDVLLVSKAEMAILGELFLRGPQTEGELRTRASRMEEIPDLDALRGHLRELKERNMILYLTAEDRRGAVLTHALQKPEEIESARRRADHVSLGAAGGESSPVRVAAPPAEWLTALEKLTSRVDQLEKELAALKQALGQ